MTKSRVILLTVFAYVTSVQVHHSQARGETLRQSKAPPTQTPALIFAEARALLVRESHVPPRLPTYLPDLDDETPLYAVVRSVNTLGYQLDLAYAKDCGGAYACTYARLRGSSAPIDVDKGDTNTPITLVGGIKGHFITYKCGANCGEPILKWNEGRFYYTIAMKASDKQTLVKIANSAIETNR